MRQTSEELALVKRAIELPYLLSSLEIDKNKILDSNVKMKSLYVNHLDHMQNKISLEMYKLKLSMKKHHIKIIKENRSELSLSVDYSLKGYRHEMTLLWSKVKVDITLILTEEMNLDITNLNRQT
ncbi:hypothetical protein ASD24_24350 [Paenibacillus sp. Root52]|uniref:hypothetical protein n=1 Tax=Paenibacillus sp. Root52 TaxID=1736552 RepID=UPI0006F9D99D|nr:hypothetical protein [Paenibacillus sp. Root52]KQY90932.1 hypothetical protein ASD24_24350 [Paenibacillus sp. Root52]